MKLSLILPILGVAPVVLTYETMLPAGVLVALLAVVWRAATYLKGMEDALKNIATRLDGLPCQKETGCPTKKTK